MQNLKTTLKNRLKNATKIAVLGVGSELRGDDVAGMLVAEEILKLKNKKIKKGRFKVFLGATAPENLTSEIKRYKPTHILMIDAADLGKKPGTIVLLKPEETTGISFSTHSLPPRIMTDYLLANLDCEIIIIGIQPKRIDFGSRLSQEVEKAAKYISDAIKAVITYNN